MVAKDLDGNTAGILRGGVHLWSPDGIDWQLAPQPRAWDLRLRWRDGTVSDVGNIDRPALLRDADGVPRALCVATVDTAEDFDRAGASWNVQIPLG